MPLKIFKALLPYYGGKRRLCPIIFRHIANHFPRDKWQGAVFVDAFLGSGAVSLYAKAQGFQIVANDAAERSYLAGKALIENNQTQLTDDDLGRLCLQTADTERFIEEEFAHMLGTFPIVPQPVKDATLEAFRKTEMRKSEFKDKIHSSDIINERLKDAF